MSGERGPVTTSATTVESANSQCVLNPISLHVVGGPCSDAVHENTVLVYDCLKFVVSYNSVVG